MLKETKEKRKRTNIKSNKKGSNLIQKKKKRILRRERRHVIQKAEEKKETRNRKKIRENCDSFYAVRTVVCQKCVRNVLTKPKRGTTRYGRTKFLSFSSFLFSISSNI